jgi:hypothetical protein
MLQLAPIRLDRSGDGGAEAQIVGERRRPGLGYVRNRYYSENNAERLAREPVE